MQPVTRHRLRRFRMPTTRLTRADVADSCRLHGVFAEETERLGLWLDTSADSPENRA